MKNDLVEEGGVREKVIIRKFEVFGVGRWWPALVFPPSGFSIRTPSFEMLTLEHEESLWNCHGLNTVTYKAENPKKFTGSKIGAIFGKITSRVTTKNLKIGQRGLFELGPFFSLFLMRKTLSSGLQWFLRPYFPLIRDMFLLRSGLRFSFWASELPEPRAKRRLHW